MRILATYGSALTLALLIAVAGAPLSAIADAESEMAPADAQLKDLYWQGQEALKQSDWPVALKRFQELEKQLRAKEPRNVDTAVYWQAYALVQARRHSEARGAAERLHREFPESRWGDEVDALVRKTQARTAASEISIDGDEELAAIAVESLLQAPPGRALPLLQKVMRSNHSTKVKKRALFVLSQLDSPEAQNTVIAVARESTDPSLRREAIHMLGVGGNKASIEKLSALYAQSQGDVRREIIQAWLIANRRDLILGAARNETDPKVRNAAVHALGAIGAKAELRQLLEASKDSRTQSAIVQSLGVAGDVEGLTAIANSQQPEAIRIEAMRSLGIAGSRGGRDALVKLYAGAASQPLRDAALQGLLITGDSKAVLGLYRVARTKEEKQALLRMITIMDGDAALDLIEAELNRQGSAQ